MPQVAYNAGLIAAMLGVIVLVVLLVAWLMKRSSSTDEFVEIRVPRRIVVESEPLLPPEVQESRQPNGIFVVMKSELIEELAALAARRRLSRSALCRELIKRGLEAEHNALNLTEG